MKQCFTCHEISRSFSSVLQPLPGESPSPLLWLASFYIILQRLDVNVLCLGGFSWPQDNPLTNPSFHSMPLHLAHNLYYSTFQSTSKSRLPFYLSKWNGGHQYSDCPMQLCGHRDSLRAFSPCLSNAWHCFMFHDSLNRCAYRIPSVV